MTKWVPVSWDAVKAGDTVRLENADGSVEITVQSVYKTRDCWEMRSNIGVYPEWYWNLFVPAPTTPALPTVRGIYVTLEGKLKDKTPLFLTAGGWQFANGQSATEAAAQWHAMSPLARLEPAATTAKQIIDRIDAMRAGGEVTTLGQVQALLAAEFGVS